MVNSTGRAGNNQKIVRSNDEACRHLSVGSCFITKRYEVPDGERVIDLQIDLETLPAFGHLCVSETAVRLLNVELGWDVDTDVKQKLKETRARESELRSENRRLRLAINSIVDAAALAGIDTELLRDDVDEPVEVSA